MSAADQPAQKGATIEVGCVAQEPPGSGAHGSVPQADSAGGLTPAAQPFGTTSPGDELPGAQGGTATQVSQDRERPDDHAPEAGRSLPNSGMTGAHGNAASRCEHCGKYHRTRASFLRCAKRVTRYG